MQNDEGHHCVETIFSNKSGNVSSKKLAYYTPLQ
jgi:hypothetical protein